VDYIGIFDDVARALDFDEKAVQQVVSNIDELRKALPVQMQKCLVFFPGVDRSVGGYEGLMAAQQCLPNNATRDRFAADYIVIGTVWEALSPDPVLSPYEKDYRWLTQVYESVKPPSGNGKLFWHALGAKTVELINENVHVESVRDNVETLVMDAQVLEEILKDAEPGKKAREIEIQLIARLRKHLGNPKFTALGERLEKIKERHEQGFLTSLEFLKAILEVAREVVEAEREADPEEERDRAKEALTELFQEAKSKNTHIIVERIVTDIDDIVKKVRFPDWQHTSQGERLVQKELRKALLKYKLHTDQELFDRAYGYIRRDMEKGHLCKPSRNWATTRGPNKPGVESILFGFRTGVDSTVNAATPYLLREYYARERGRLCLTKTLSGRFWLAHRPHLFRSTNSMST
jgi:type I restriction enzyme R subunit